MVKTGRKSYTLIHLNLWNRSQDEAKEAASPQEKLTNHLRDQSKNDNKRAGARRSPSQLPPISPSLISSYTTHSLSHDQPKSGTGDDILDLLRRQHQTSVPLLASIPIQSERLHVEVSRPVSNRRRLVVCRTRDPDRGHNAFPYVDRRHFDIRERERDLEERYDFRMMRSWRDSCDFELYLLRRWRTL